MTIGASVPGSAGDGAGGGCWQTVAAATRTMAGPLTFRRRMFVKGLMTKLDWGDVSLHQVSFICS